jgi:hypothetical protein
MQLDVILNFIDHLIAAQIAKKDEKKKEDDDYTTTINHQPHIPGIS